MLIIVEDLFERYLGHKARVKSPILRKNDEIRLFVATGHSEGHDLTGKCETYKLIRLDMAHKDC